MDRHNVTSLAGEIAFVDPEHHDDWPETDMPGIRRFLGEVVRKQPAHFVANATGVQAHLLRVGPTVLPVMESDGRPGKASMLSPVGHHLSYPLFEITRGHSLPYRALVHILLAPLSFLFWLGALNRVVYLNHWLTSGVPDPDVPDDAWPEVIAVIARRFPRHAILVPDIKPRYQALTAQALSVAGGLPVPTRRVFMIDPGASVTGTRFKSIRYHQNKMVRIFQQSEQLLLPLDVARKQTARMVALYSKSYLARHSTLNPAYTQAFFDVTLMCETAKLFAWRAECEAADPEKIEAFSLQQRDNRMVHWSCFGREPPERTPGGEVNDPNYQRVIATDFAISRIEGLLFDLGGGADHVKKSRGAIACLQTEVVFLQHLPWWRRSVWKLLAMLRRLRARQLGWPQADDERLAR